MHQIQENILSVFAFDGSDLNTHAIVALYLFIYLFIVIWHPFLHFTLLSSVLAHVLAGLTKRKKNMQKYPEISIAIILFYIAHP